MSELVERLRTMAQHLPEQRSIFREAASEIERLERELKHQKDLTDGYKRLAQS